MRKYSIAHLCWVKPDMQLIVVQKLRLDPVSPADAKLHVVRIHNYVDQSHFDQKCLLCPGIKYNLEPELKEPFFFHPI